MSRQDLTTADQKYEELVKRVKEVADYTIETGASTRQVAKFFTENRPEFCT